MVAKAVALQRQNGWARFVTGQLYYSLVGRELEEATIPACRDAGVGIMAWSPLAGGFLSGKYTIDDRRAAGQLDHFSFIPIDRGYAERVVFTLVDIAAKHDTTPASVALAWLVEQAGVATVLLGVTSVSQFEENLASSSLNLDQADMRLLEEASAPAETYPHWYNRVMADEITAMALGPRRATPSSDQRATAYSDGWPINAP